MSNLVKYIIVSSLVIVVCGPSAIGGKYLLPADCDILVESQKALVAQIGIIEEGYNRGQKIEEYQRSVGIPIGSPYCAAGQYYVYKLVCDTYNWPYSLIPIPRTGRANYYYDYAVKHGNKDKFQPEIHDLLIWRLPKTSRGHVERIILVGAKGWVITVGFNTSSGSGDQRDGEGVFKRKRNIYHPLGRMRIRGLVGFYRSVINTDCGMK